MAVCVARYLHTWLEDHEAKCFSCPRPSHTALTLDEIPSGEKYYALKYFEGENKILLDKEDME
jgi:hypothetical protein